jgi:anti-sigma regulatory factor (Ser/Thr protein kinase)
MTLSVLPEWGIDSDTADQVLLVVSELVTNAVEHANPPVTLHLDRPTLDGTLHIEVDDGGPAAQDGIWARSCTPEERGRGYAVIDLLATAHGIRALTCGATHWADLPAA